MNDIIVESVDVPMKRPLVTGGGTVDSAPLVLIRLKAGDIKGASYVFCRRAGVFLEGIGPIGATEIWYYNQSPSRLLRILTFHRGRLRSVETGGRGFNENPVRNACDPYRLNIGMSKYELLKRCGEPIALDRWLEHTEHTGSPFHRRHHLHGTVVVEEWTYAFGSNRFRRHIRIIDGRVVAIERGGKGG